MRHESTDGWMVRTLREAAWAPLLVVGPVVLADRFFAVYTLVPWLDLPTHFLGGLAVAHFFWRASVNAPAAIIEPVAVRHMVMALAGAIGMALLWELFEFLVDRLLLTQMQHGMADTVSDVVLSVAGGMAYLVLRRWRDTS